MYIYIYKSIISDSYPSLGFSASPHQESKARRGERRFQPPLTERMRLGRGSGSLRAGGFGGEEIFKKRPMTKAENPKTPTHRAQPNHQTPTPRRSFTPSKNRTSPAGVIRRIRFPPNPGTFASGRLVRRWARRIRFLSATSNCGRLVCAFKGKKETSSGGYATSNK